uniref:Uncharacterized protein n=1 Tax=Lepeophtheirus salmonis TaxID=72036 RepID=A0A0K2TFR3_LEPSM
MFDITPETISIELQDETIEKNHSGIPQSPLSVNPSSMKSVRFSDIELFDKDIMVQSNSNHIAQYDDDGAINMKFDFTKSKYDRFISMISSVLPLSKNPEIEIEDTLSLEDLTSYLHPGAQEYINEDLGGINRSILEKTPRWYILPDKTSTPDKIFTGVLIISTAIAIIILFVYQNFGPGLLKRTH